MSLWHIAWSYLWNRKFTTCLTILSVALGVGLISAVLTLREETRKRFEEEGLSFDMVVGAKGNPLQLVLSAVYYLDAPTGNIGIDEYERLKEEYEVDQAFPISLGDTYRGYRIVGTLPEIFDYTPVWSGEKLFRVAEGEQFNEPFEAVIGAGVVDGTGKKIGDTFLGAHGISKQMGGHVHENHPYTIVGILERSGTPNDRAIFTHIESTYRVHEEDPADYGPGDGGEEGQDVHDEHEGEDEHEGHDHAEGEDVHEHHHNPRDQVTAVLVSLKSPGLRLTFRGKVNNTYKAMAVIPIEEINKLYEQLLGTAKMVLLAIGYLVVVISSLSILIGLYLSIIQRKRDLAIMRALGASAGEVFGSVIIEAFWVTLLGIGFGWFLGALTTYALGLYMVKTIGLAISAFQVSPDMTTAYSAVLLMGMVAGILPAWQAYRTDVARDLAEL